MAEPFLSEIRIMSFVFPPRGWALCNGQLLPINQNQGLFSLLGTTYGGDGRVNFALPNLQGRTPIHVGNGHTLGERAGEQAVTLNAPQIPMHTHVVQGSTTNATVPAPTNNLLARGSASNGNPINYYAPATGPLTTLSTTSVSSVGGSQAHLNMQPYLTLSFCIALQGIFPSQT
jgi:microcystin-dependent protein